MRNFASDNNSGAHPAIIEAISSANCGHVQAYGDDSLTIETKKLFQQHFGEGCDTHFVLTGTGANVLALKAMTHSWNSILATDIAHINGDECGAPEKITGCKIVTVEHRNGKLHPDQLKPHMHVIGEQHHSQPGAVSITQPTELGTLYTVDEIKEIADFCRHYNMPLHMDGARISNAAVAMDMDFREFTVDAGVDALSFGGTKNGMIYGEALLFFNNDFGKGLPYMRKQNMQLASKMRFISAQFKAFLSNNLWKDNAIHANKAAAMLAENIAHIPELELIEKAEANGLFVKIPSHWIEPLQDEYFFYIWDREESVVRWMTSFDTREEDIERFTGLLKKNSSPNS